ncbi:MAG: hypothetical protein O3C63_06820 [Cyanobacteria bacterium]|nr:hypothetical protein [Cyanobacteriota bacterium]MDA1021656.1 hypothetical protein [Cyanobacteriota bacterium]
MAKRGVVLRSRGESGHDFTLDKSVEAPSARINLVVILLDLIHKGSLDSHVTVEEKAKLIQFFLNHAQASEELEREVTDILERDRIKTLINDAIEFSQGHSIIDD